MNSFNYYLHKDSKTGEVVYLEYNKNGYKVSPKLVIRLPPLYYNAITRNGDII